jgi:peptide/nickel transport system substrate-binding protein
MVVANDAETLDPRFAADSTAIRVTRLVHAGLTGLDPNTMAPRPYVARSWSWIDERTLRVELREDVRFHSGAEVAPRDVVATLRAFGAPGSRQAHVVSAIASAEADGDHAVVIRLARAHATLLTDLELPILRADEADGAAKNDGSLDGLGPYRISRAERGAIELVPADDGAMPRPAHAVTIRTVHDENARALRLEAGRADVALNTISPTLLPAIATEPGLAVTSRSGANLTYLVVRVNEGALADLSVRRAISLGIDRIGIARTLLGGHAQPADTLVSPTHWAYSPPPAPYAFDPEAARALLAGRRVHATLLTSTDRLRITLARAIAQELADVGVDLEIVPLELGTMLARLKAGDFELAALQLPELQEPNVLRVFLHSASIPPAGSNRGRVRSAAIDGLLDRGDAAMGEDARRAIYAEFEERVREELPIIPLWHEDQVAVTSERARGFVPSADGRWLGLALLR